MNPIHVLVLSIYIFPKIMAHMLVELKWFDGAHLHALPSLTPLGPTKDIEFYERIEPGFHFDHAYRVTVSARHCSAQIKSSSPHT